MNGIYLETITINILSQFTLTHAIILCRIMKIYSIKLLKYLSFVCLRGFQIKKNSSFDFKF